MLRVDRNDYFNNPKNSDVSTPPALAAWLCDLVFPVVGPKVVLDPAVGGGNLLIPFKERGCFTQGIDVYPREGAADLVLQADFEDLMTWESTQPDLIVCNPPFNGASGRRLYPEVFLDKVLSLFGYDIPCILFTPMTFRLNQRICSKRYKKYRDTGPEITTIIAGLIDMFSGIQFQSEILFFNIRGLSPHYWLPTKVVDHLSEDTT